MSCSIPASKARRLRDAATKRRLFKEAVAIQQNKHDSDMIREIHSAISQSGISGAWRMSPSDLSLLSSAQTSLEIKIDTITNCIYQIVGMLTSQYATHGTDVGDFSPSDASAGFATSMCETIDPNRCWNVLAEEFKPSMPFQPTGTDDGQAELLDRERMLAFRDMDLAKHQHPRREPLIYTMRIENIGQMCDIPNMTGTSSGDPFDAENCKRCDKCEETLSECVCFDIYCGNCWKVAEQCRCAQPRIHRHACAVCGTPEETVSLFDTVLQQAPYPTTFKCSSCQSSEAREIEFLGLAGAHVCQTCSRVTGQDTIVACEGDDCVHTGLFHEACMEKHFDKLLCLSCSGNLAQQNCAAQVVNNTEQIRQLKLREQKVSEFEQRVAGVLNIIDAVDAGRLGLPKPCRDLALGLAKDCHSWLMTSPPASEFDAKIAHIDKVMGGMMKKKVNLK